MTDRTEIEAHLFDAYDKARTIRDQAQGDMKAIRARIDALAANADDELDIYVEGGAFAGTFNVVTTQKFDTKGFKQDYPDIYNAYSTLTSTRVLKLESPDGR